MMVAKNIRPASGFRNGAGSSLVGDRRAFSLVEVTLSLGILSFAFLSVVGLLPVGLEVSREAMDLTVSQQITSGLVQEVQQTDFSGLERMAAESVARPRCFDDQGGRVFGDGSAGYRAALQVTPSTELPSGGVTHRLARVTVWVLGTRGREAGTFNEWVKDPRARRTSFLVPDNGR